MATAVARQSAAASNLANLDTPGYRSREVFAQVLDSELGEAPALARTSTAHFSNRVAGGAATVSESDALPTRRDGNNVQLDKELLSMTRAAGDFSAAQTALAAKFRLVRYAINEGR